MEKVIRYSSQPGRHDRLIKLIGQYSFVGGAIVSVLLLVASAVR